MDSEVIDRERGMYNKFNVTRTDGSSAPGGKHDGCEYFVLDLTHDKHAAAALRAYAESCAAEYPQLAADLRAKAGPALARPSAAGDAVAYRVTLHDGSTMLTPALHIAQAFEDSTFVPLYTAPPVAVSDAMVDRALIAFMQSATKGAWTYQARMEAALTAALTGAQP